VDYHGANKKTLESLIRAGALDALQANRAQLLAGLELLMGYGQQLQQEKASGQASLFGSSPEAPALPKTAAWDAMTKLQEEFSAIGFFLSAHPLDQFKRILERLNVVPSAQLAQKAKGASMTRFRVAGVVLSVSIKKSKAGNTFAFAQVSDSSGVFEMTVFSEVLASHRALLEAGKRVLASVDVQVQEEGVRLTCFSLEPLDEALDRVQSGLVINLNASEGLHLLHDQLEKAKGGKQAVSLIVNIHPGREAEISLPGGFNLIQEAQQALYAIPGVVEIGSF
jgi:DNA polymerase-3 subunit alpha